ncbi:MAG: addiction module protein [Chloroflexi bacterium]|nr:addiction module protein [Chloroflexota bacterium]
MEQQNTSRLLKELLKLPVETRAELAGRLLDSLEESSDSDAESAWEAESAARLNELDASEVQTIPWPEARRVIHTGRHLCEEIPTQPNSSPDLLS